jgi:hypothetical protein
MQISDVCPARSGGVQQGGVMVAVSSTRGTAMIRFSSCVAATAVASLLLIGSASAQTTAPTTPAAKSDTKSDTKMAPAEKKPRTAASLQCSKDADGKGLHGKERKKFMSECKKEAKAKPS